MSKKISHRTLAAYAERELPPSEAKEVEAELAGSPELRRRLDRYRELCDALAAPIPELERLDLAAMVSARARVAPAPRPSVRSRPWVWSGALAAAACVALAVGMVGRRPRPTEGEVRARGGAQPDGERWQGVRLFLVKDGSAPTPLADGVGVHDGVLVSYSNLGPKPFDFLMVFAVDSQGQVAWLYPAWEKSDEDPSSVPIRRSVAGVELRSLIHPAWTVGRVTIHALFTRQALKVREVEAMLSAQRLIIPDSAEQHVEISVVP
jgi:hypothetical protein